MRRISTLPRAKLLRSTSRREEWVTITFTMATVFQVGISGDASGLLKRFLFYLEFSTEREEILRHKWIELEKAGKDIGYHQALVR